MGSLAARQTNLLKAGFSYLYGTITGNPSISGMPAAISVELTNHCNLSCPECASGSGMIQREKGFMDPDLYKRILSELKPYLLNINLYFQGESMMHPGFFSFPDLAGDIRTVVSTNGHFLTEENSEKLARSRLKKLIVSLDGMDQTTYSEYRKNGDFSRVTEGIRNVSAAISALRSPLKLEIQFLVNKFNEHQIAEAKRFAAETGARLSLKSMQVNGNNDPERWMPAADKFRRYYEASGNFRIRSILPDRCMRLWFNPVVTWDGRVVPCCFDKDAGFVMGDLKTESFRSVWNGTAYSDFRKMILTGRKKVAICRNCTSGLSRKVIR